MRKKIMFTVVIILLFFFIIEIFTRIVYFQKDSLYSTGTQQLVRHISYKFGILDPQIYQIHAEYGYFNTAHSKGQHIHPRGDFNVKYSIDQNQCRITPDPLSSKGNIVILGCSFSFGWGVNDNENYPYILGKKFWNEWKIRNISCNGWGTAHAFLAFKNEIKKKPKVILYAFIPAHIKRNYVSKNVLSKYAPSFWFREPIGAKHPHFEIIDGHAVFQKWTDIGIPYSEEIYEKEKLLTFAFLDEMDKLSKEQNIPFVVLLLPGFNSNWPVCVVEHLINKKIKYLDLTDLQFSRFKNDNHPNALDHQKISQKISNSFIKDILK